MKNLLLLTSICLVGCSTVDVNQTSKITETHLTNGTVIVERSVTSQMSGIGEAKNVIDKLRATQTKSGTITVGAEGVDSETSSPQLIELLKTLKTLGEAFAK